MSMVSHDLKGLHLQGINAESTHERVETRYFQPHGSLVFFHARYDCSLIQPKSRLSVHTHEQLDGTTVMDTELLRLISSLHSMSHGFPSFGVHISWSLIRGSFRQPLYSSF